MIRKVKTSAKIFESDPARLRRLVLSTMDKIARIVGATLGPGGRNVLVESDYPGIPNKNTKDGVTVFSSLGSSGSYEHLIIEQARDAARRTATEAGDGTTTATILSNALVQNLYSFTDRDKKYSPQKAAREMSKIVRERLVPMIREKAIKIDMENRDLLRMVAKVSANGDEDMANAVIQAFELIGYGDSSHVTIKELSGPYGYEVGLIEGFPVAMGYEESIGKFHTAFINDQGNQRCYLEKPLFLLFDGQIIDLVMIQEVLERIGQEYANGNSDFKNLVIFAHGFSENVLTNLAYNFANPNTINVVPMVTPMAQFKNSQLHFLNDLAAFTGAKVFSMTNKVNEAQPSDLGRDMETFEAYRFRSTVVGNSDSVNIEVRADELKKMKSNSESTAEKIWLEERLGKLTNGIAKLTIYGGSSGELKEAHDRCEDAVCAVRSAISKGALAGGCRTLIDLATSLQMDENAGPVAHNILVPALMAPAYRLLENAGYTGEEISQIIEGLIIDPNVVYDLENHVFGKAEELGIFDSAPAVEEALKNATSIATVMGTIGGVVAYPRDDKFEREEAAAEQEFEKATSSPELYINEANVRP